MNKPTAHTNALRDLTDEEWIRFEETMSAKRWVAVMMLTGVWICEHQSSKKLTGGPYGSLKELALDVIFKKEKTKQKERQNKKKDKKK